MARGSSSNVAENRTRSKRGTPTKEVEEKQTSDSVDKKSVVTRRKNTATAASKVEKKVNKNSDKLEAGNSSETCSSSNKNEELNLANKLVGKKEVPKNNPQIKASKAIGRKRKVESTVDEMADETIGIVESEIVGKKLVSRQNKKLITDIMEGSQDSIKSTKSDFNKNAENTKKVEDVATEEFENEDKDSEVNIEASEGMEKTDNIQEKDLSTILDDNSQSSIKSGTIRNTRSTRKVGENITVKQIETKDLTFKDQDEFEAKKDIVDDTSQNAMKPIKGSSARKTRSAKKIDEDIIVEQKETIAVEVNKDLNSDDCFERVDIFDENSLDSVKKRKTISTRKTRSTKTTEESVVQLINKEQKDTEKIELGDLVMKDKTDTINNNDDVPTMPIKSSIRKTRNTKNIDESIVVELEDIKTKEIKEKIICSEKVDPGQDSSFKKNEGGSTRRTRSARKVAVKTDVELKESKAEELKTNIKIDVHDDSSIDSIKSNQSGPTRRTRNTKKVSENVAQNNINTMPIEKNNAEVNTSDDSSLDSTNSKLSGSLKKTRNAKKVGEREITIEKQNDDTEKNDRNEEKVELCSSDNNSKDSFDANKGIAAENDKVNTFIEKKLSKDTDKVLEEIICKEVEGRIEKDEKKIDSDCANDNSHDLFVQTKKIEDFEQKECNDMKFEDSDNKESNFEKLDDNTKNFESLDKTDSKLEAKTDHYENNNITSLHLNEQDSKENVVDFQEAKVLKTCGEDNLAGNKINFERENEGKVIENKYADIRDCEDGNAIVEQIKKNKLEEKDSTKIFYKNKEDCDKIKMKECDDADAVSEIEKDVSGRRTEETALFEKVINPEVFDENKQSKCQTLVENNQSSNVDVLIQEEKCKEANNLKMVEIVVGNKTADESAKELKLTDSEIYQTGTEEISIKTSITNISENIDHEDSTTSMIGEIEISEKASVDIDVCSDKTEEASVVNFESESSTTDSDTGNLVIADTVENTNTETDISKMIASTAHVVSGCSDIEDTNQEDISSRIMNSEKTEMAVTSCIELSTATISETSINNITGNQLELEADTVKGPGVTVSEFEMPATTQDGTENSLNKDANDKSSSQVLAEADKIEELKSSQIRSENFKENILEKSTMNNSMSNKETADSEPKIVSYVKSIENKISKDSIQTPLTITNTANISSDKNFAESCSSPDKIVVDSCRGESNSDEKQKTSKKKKSGKSVKKTTLDVKEVGENEAGKKIITTYEVFSNVDSKKGAKRNLADEGAGSSSTEVSLALKIKRKRVEGVDSYDVSPSSLGEHPIPSISDETSVKEQAQKLFADYQSEPGPSGMQESRRSTRKRKREESDREKSAAPIRMYLEKFVPFLLEGLLKITYVRPEDPIQYLAEWMKENKEAAYSSMNIKDNGDVSSDE